MILAEYAFRRDMPAGCGPFRIISASLPLCIFPLPLFLSALLKPLILFGSILAVRIFVNKKTTAKHEGP